jgi:hypothetical protein
MRMILRYGWLCAIVLLAATSTRAQDNRMTAQRVDSRKGYILRIPDEAKLDSSASGWSPTGMFERRVYRIPGAGQIRLTVTVRPMTTPDGAKANNAYTYLDADSATPGGSAKIRTYYLPTRSVRIEFVPDGMNMLRYIDAREAVYASFRWKPGATTDDINVGPPSRAN